LRRLLTLSVSFFSVVSSVSIRAEGVHWIWSSDSPRATAAELTRTFSTDARAQHAAIHLAGDFCDASLELNGSEVARVHRGEARIRGDVTRHLRRGRNVIVVRATKLGGPAAVAVELVVTSATGLERTTASDATWRAKTGAVSTFGRADTEPWWRVEAPSTSSFDDYNQFQEARAEESVMQAVVPPGFRLDTIHRTDDSWVSLLLDKRGRFLLGRESKGILRWSPATSVDGKSTLETIDDSLSACHGLLLAHDSLFVMANNSRGLFRLTDTDRDGRFDEKRRLKTIPGGGGDHGRHYLVSGSDGEIYAIVGDAATMADSFVSRVPATREFGPSRRPLAGHLIRTDAEAEGWEVFASGLRNPFGLALSPDGELFTYDADSESDSGLPWYRPTRIVHLVQGTDYGWRRDDRKWPGYFPESLPAVATIGKGSPTGVKFGTRSNFPPAYRKALFALDWTYGRIIATHLVPQGAGYLAYPETFAKGRPFNVVDLDFEADGSMVLVSGGSGTRSSLYRLSYVGDIVEEREPTRQEHERREYSATMRKLRRRLESLQSRDAPAAVEVAWPFLDHPDPWIRNAARVAIEHQRVSDWKRRALLESHAARRVCALLALARVGPSSLDPEILSSLLTIDLVALPTEFQLAAARIATLARPEGDDLRSRLLEQFEPLFPGGHRGLNRELAELLVTWRSREVVAGALRRLAGGLSQVDAFHFLIVLSRTSEGWSPRRRQEYFRLLRGARLYQGDKVLPGVVRRTEEAALGNVPEAERSTYERVLERRSRSAGKEVTEERAFVRKWKAEELERPAGFRANHKRGEAVFREAQCSRCHRMGPRGRAFGPDLTAIAARFARRDLIDAILSPSRSVPSRYRQHVITTRDGKVVTGQVVWNSFRASTIHLASDPRRLEDVTKIHKRDILSRRESTLSPMPQGLLDSFTREEILDLLAYLLSGR